MLLIYSTALAIPFLTDSAVAPDTLTTPITMSIAVFHVSGNNPNELRVFLVSIFKDSSLEIISLNTPNSFADLFNSLAMVSFRACSWDLDTKSLNPCMSCLEPNM